AQAVDREPHAQRVLGQWARDAHAARAGARGPGGAHRRQPDLRCRPARDGRHHRRHRGPLMRALVSRPFVTALASRTLALHAAYWQLDPWYKRLWFAWPQAMALLLAGWLMADRVSLGNWAKPADCSSSDIGCAATQRSALVFPEQVLNPTIVNQPTI